MGNFLYIFYHVFTHIPFCDGWIEWHSFSSDAWWHQELQHFKHGNLKNQSDISKEEGIKSVDFQGPCLWIIICICVFFPFFQLSNMSDELCKEIEKITKKKEKMKKNYMWIRERKTTRRNGCCKRRFEKKSASFTFKIHKSTTLSSLHFHPLF